MDEDLMFRFWVACMLHMCFASKKRQRLKLPHALRVIFSEYRESEDTHEKSIFLLFHQNIPIGELIKGKIV